MKRCGLLGQADGLAQALLYIVDNCEASLVFCCEVWCIEMQMGNDTDAMFDMVEDEDRFGETKDCQGQIQLILLRKRQALEACDGVICQIANGTTMKCWELVLRSTIWTYQTILAQFGLN